MKQVVLDNFREIMDRNMFEILSPTQCLGYFFVNMLSSKLILSSAVSGVISVRHFNSNRMNRLAVYSYLTQYSPYRHAVHRTSARKEFRNFD